MGAATVPTRHRSALLKEQTRVVHDGVDTSVMRAAAFDDLAGYGRFVCMQYRFHRDIAELYRTPALAALLPGLSQRRRLELIEADLADLGLDPPDSAQPPEFTAAAVDVPTALGWLYVAEGSNMGAALLRKQAAKLGLSNNHGARHLAPAPEGAAAHWRAFTVALDAAPLAVADEQRVGIGARSAFVRVQMLIDDHLG